MTNKQESYEKMSSSSVSYLLANNTITATLPNFASPFGIIQTTLGQIQTARLLQEADKSGDTANKKLLRLTAISQTIDIGRRVVAYATNVNNQSLLELVNYTESDLKKSSDDKLVSICQIIHDNANANLANLGTYGVTAAILTAQQTAITNFNNSIPKIRLNKTDSEQATKNLENYFDILKVNWDKIDCLVEMVRTSQPAFYNEYKNVRKVIDTGRSTLPLKIKALNAETGEGEPNVKVTLKPSNGIEKAAALNGNGTSNGNGNGIYANKTAENGGLNPRNLADGTYDYTAEKPGRKTVKGKINVVNGETSYLEIKMEKE